MNTSVPKMEFLGSENLKFVLRVYVYEIEVVSFY